MNVKLRQEIERRVGTILVQSLLAAGYEIGVDNGGDDEEYRGNDKKAILREMFATDEDRLYVYRPGAKQPMGWAYLVYGNDGFDTLSDYTVNLEPHMDKLNEYLKKYD